MATKTFSSDLVPIDVLCQFVDVPTVFTDTRGRRFTSTQHLLKLYDNTEKMRLLQLKRLERSQKLLSSRDVL